LGLAPLTGHPPPLAVSEIEGKVFCTIERDNIRSIWDPRIRTNPVSTGLLDHILAGSSPTSTLIDAKFVGDRLICINESPTKNVVHCYDDVLKGIRKQIKYNYDVTECLVSDNLMSVDEVGGTYLYFALGSSSSLSTRRYSSLE